MLNTVFADALASADCADQAEFLNRYARVVECLSKNNNYGGTGMTQLYIAEHLEKETADFLMELCRTHDSVRETYRSDLMRRDKLREEISELEAQRKSLGAPKAPDDGLAF